MKEKVRFAPSPTGYLHVGGARTSLFNWLYARKTKGTFVLRIEDTDLERSTEESVNAIFEGMKWLDMDWDEGPFFQTERTDLYKKYIDELLDNGHAYKCYCTPEELNHKRELAKSEKRTFSYDRTCRDLKEAKEVPFTVRLKAPLAGDTTFNDLVKGKIAIGNEELDDYIIARSDGSPTYNFTVVVDDYLMGITKVIRGDDHINNTPKQILIYEALGWKLPNFAHVPMILGADKTRLSKRHGATSVIAYRDMGYLSEALINYLVRLSWSHGDQEIFSIDEMKELFDISKIGKSAGVFNPEKLLWLNAHYIKTKDDEELAELAMPFLRKLVDEKYEIGRGKLNSLMPLLKGRAKLLTELAEQSAIYFVSSEDIEYEEKGFEKFVRPGKELLEHFLSKLETIDNPSEENLTPVFKEMLSKFEVKFVKIAQALRVAFTGGTTSPGIFEVVEILGKEETMKRIKRAIDAV